MFASGRWFCTAALASFALLAGTATLAQAQPGRSAFYSYTPINPNPSLFFPSTTLQQSAYNLSVGARAASNIPPYLLGYNPYQAGYGAPYIPAVSGYGYNPALTAGYGYGGYGGYNPVLSTAYNPYLASPYLGTNPGLVGGPSLSTTPGYGTPGYSPTLSTTPNYTGSPSSYGGGSYYGDYSDAASINSIANLTNATAQYEVTMGKARLVQEEVTRSRLLTRRLIQEEAERELKNRPNHEEVHQKEIENSINRARHDPPIAELLSGKSLNDLLNHLKNQHAKSFRGAKVSLEDIDLSLVNVGPANEVGNIGLVKNLKQGDKLGWPSALMGDAYAEPRGKLDSRLPNAVSQLRIQKNVPDGDLRDLEDSVKQMMDTLNANIGDLSPSQYISSKRFLNLVQDSINAMKAPGAINYFNGTWVAKGRNVAELVDHMRDKGLQFTAATPGSEATYRALHSQFITFDATMTLIEVKK